MQLKTLGGLRLEPSVFTQPKPLLLLSYLSLEGNQQRRHLAELFWPQGNSLKSLSMTLTRLRQGAGEIIEADDKRAWTKLPSDVSELLESLDKSQWQRATKLYSGAFLEGVILEDWSTELEEWVYSTREYLAERVQFALLKQAEDAAQAQNFKQAASLAEQAYKLPGLAGHDFVTLKRLYSLLCAGSSTLAPVVRKEAEAFDLKLELSTQAAQAQFAGEVAKAASALPTRNTSFVGRNIELAELSDLLQRPEVRLLTVVGAGGVGKTRLALQLAHEQRRLGHFEDGVHMVLLESLPDATLLPQTLLSHFGIIQQQHMLEQLLGFLAQKHMLLVLDNFEHLTAAAPLLSQLLSHCPRLKLLVTSRETLKLEEEYVFTLTGLEVASDHTPVSDALRLFKDRAKQRNPHFDLNDQLADAERICKLLDGLPLGIELAASWVNLMPCSEIASEIEESLEFLSSNHVNIPERHRSLRAVFESSWERLNPKEQVVLRKLSVFRGGFRREAASEVAGATIPVLASLVDKSLLRVLPNGRYDRHPLLYQFTQEKLADMPDEQCRVTAKHTQYYVRFVQQAETALFSKQRAAWLQQLDEEIENVRVVLQQAKVQRDCTTGLLLIIALGEFWHTRGYHQEACDHLEYFLLSVEQKDVNYIRALNTLSDLFWKQGGVEKAHTHLKEAQRLGEILGDAQVLAKTLGLLARVYHYNLADAEKAKHLYQQSIQLAQSVGHQAHQASALNLLAILVSEQGDFEGAQSYYQQGLKLWQELGNSSGIAFVLNNMANLYNGRGQVTEATHLFEQSLDLFRSLGEKDGMAMALGNLGLIYTGLGDYLKAISLLEESLSLARIIGDQRHIAFLLRMLGRVYFYQGNFPDAQTHFQTSHDIYQQLGYTIGITDALSSIAELQHALQDWCKAYVNYQKALQLSRDHNDIWGITLLSRQLAKLYLDQQNYLEATTPLLDSLQGAQQLESSSAIVLTLEVIAEYAVATYKLEQATVLLAYTDNWRQQHDICRDPYEAARYQNAIGFLRQHLPAFKDCYQEGQMLGLEALEAKLSKKQAKALKDFHPTKARLLEDILVLVTDSEKLSETP